MKALLGWLSVWTLVIAYFSGIVLAKGFWSTLCAIWSPWGLYLVVEKVLITCGVVL